MMNITLNNKDYQLHFGLDFINYLDKKHYIEQNGFKIGHGLATVLTQIDMGNPAILFDLIMAGTKTGVKPSEQVVKDYLETEADIEELMANFLQNLEKAPLTKFTLKKLGIGKRKK